jgi:glycosyltransferase involved in cell wall biosynthesis
VDGTSEDETKEIIHAYQQSYAQIKLLNNPEKTVPYAMNAAIYAAKGDYIIRLDAHSEYKNNYISKCVLCLKKTGADNVGGPMIAMGKTRLQKIIAASYSSKFAMGCGAFHNANHEGAADTVYLGAFKKNTLLAIGLFDERFKKNQDDELNYRIIKSGGKIYQSPEIKSVYYPRSSLKELFIQFYSYGFYKVLGIKKHKKPARLTHLVPALFVMFVLFGAIAAILNSIAFYFYIAIWVLYAGLDIYFSFSVVAVHSFSDRCMLLWVHFLLHFSYGCGFLHGMLTFGLSKR